MKRNSYLDVKIFVRFKNTSQEYRKTDFNFSSPYWIK